MMAIAFKHPLSYNLARQLKTLTNPNNSRIHFENNDEYLHRNKQTQYLTSLAVGLACRLIRG
jgi:hypothetical protein